jgi:hypothetical protein
MCCSFDGRQFVQILATVVYPSVRLFIIITTFGVKHTSVCWLLVCAWLTLTLKMEAVCSSETTVTSPDDTASHLRRQYFLAYFPYFEKIE